MRPAPPTPTCTTRWSRRPRTPLRSGPPSTRCTGRCVHGSRRADLHTGAGWTRSSAGAPVRNATSGPPLGPLQQPASLRVIWLRTGNAQASITVPILGPPVPPSGPPVYPQQRPAQARRPLPPHGRVSAKPWCPGANPTSMGLRSTRRKARSGRGCPSCIPALAGASGNPGAPVRNPRGPGGLCATGAGPARRQNSRPRGPHAGARPQPGLRPCRQASLRPAAHRSRRPSPGAAPAPAMVPRLTIRRRARSSTRCGSRPAPGSRRRSARAARSPCAAPRFPNPTTGPAFFPFRQPVHAKKPLFRLGRSASQRGLLSNPTPGPAVYPLQGPVRARLPLLHPRAAGPRQCRRTGQQPHCGPSFALRFPAGHASRRPSPRAAPALPGAPLSNPTAGPTFRPFRQPVQAKKPLFRLGRAESLPGAPVRNPTSGPAVYAPQGPVRARLPQLHPRAGRVTSSPGAPLANPGSGPAVKPLAGPVQAKRPLFLLGRVEARPGAPAANPTSGPVFRQAVQAIRARILQTFSKGRVSGNAGAPLFQVGPKFYPLNRPARAPVPARVRALPPQGHPGAPLANPTSGPAVTPQQRPSQARRPAPPWPDRVQCGCAGPEPVAGGFRAAVLPVPPGRPDPHHAPATRAQRGQPWRTGPQPDHGPGGLPTAAAGPRAGPDRVQQGPRSLQCRRPAVQPDLGPVVPAVHPAGAGAHPAAIPQGPHQQQPGCTAPQPHVRARRQATRGTGPGEAAPVPPRPHQQQPRCPGHPRRARRLPAAPAGPLAARPAAPARRPGVRERWRSRRQPHAGPAVYPPQGPVRPRLPQLHPRAGRATGNPGAPLANPTTGPAFRQFTEPARARIPQNFTKGRAYGNMGAPVHNPAAVHLQPLNKALRAQPAVFLKGRIAGNPGAPVSPPPTSGPKFYPLNHPAGNAFRAPGPFRKGSAQWRTGPNPVPPAPAVMPPAVASVVPYGPLAAVAFVSASGPLAAVTVISPSGALAASAVMESLPAPGSRHDRGTRRAARRRSGSDPAHLR